MAETVIFAETTYEGFTLNEDYGAYLLNINPVPYVLTLGETYKVVWDEVAYECVAVSTGTTGDGNVETLSLGNLGVVGIEGGNCDAPFIIGWSPAGATLFSFDAKTSHTVGIYQSASDPNVILSEQTVSGFTTGEAAAEALMPIVVGETYHVTWDNETHTCIAYAPPNSTDTGVVALGNQAYIEWMYGGQNGDLPELIEPFVVVFSPASTTGSVDTLGFLCATGNCPSDAHTVGVYQVSEPDKEYLIWGSTLKGIANAIRAKNGTTGEIAVSQMAAQISEISGGGSDVEVVYVTFLSYDGATELFRRAVIPGNDCMEIVSGGLINPPTRESSNAYNYTFDGWATTIGGGTDSNALKNVTADRTVYANHIATTRYYTVRFYDGDTLLNTMQVTYGASAFYTPEKDGYQFDGWTPSNTNITTDTDCYAQWSTKLTLENATWAQIAEISEAGEAADYFAVGDTKTIPYGDDTITVAIAGFDHDDLSDGSGKAGISFICTTIPNQTVKWCNSTSNTRYYYNSNSLNHSIPRRDTLPTFLANLPSELQGVIKSVNKTYDTSNDSGEYPTLGTVADKLWIPSVVELGYDYSGVKTKKYISELGSRYELFEAKDIFTKSISSVYIGTTATATSYWTRNRERIGSQSITYIGSGGCAYQAAATGTTNFMSTLAVRFGFCV